MTSRTLVDQKSYELAQHFLADDDVRDLTPAQEKERTMSLACAIQRAVEEWFEDHGTERELSPAESERALSEAFSRAIHSREGKTT